jgi:hypothetical protein
MSQQQIEASVAASSEIPSAILSSMTAMLSSPTDTGSVPTLTTAPTPTSQSIAKSQKLEKTADEYNRTGPDSQGWYTRTYTGGYGNLYTYVEKIRYATDTLQNKFTNPYSGTDSSYSYAIDFECIKNANGLLNGYYDVEEQMNSYESDTNTGDHFRLEFSNCDPETGAGINCLLISLEDGALC